MVVATTSMNAIALNSAMFNAARIVGPALAGSPSRAGAQRRFYLNAASFVRVIVALFAVGAQGRPRAARVGRWPTTSAEGVRFAVSTPRVALTMAMVLAVSGFLFNYNVLIPLYVRDCSSWRRGVRPDDAMLGIGALGGAVALPRSGGSGRGGGAGDAGPAAGRGTAALAAGIPSGSCAAAPADGFCGILFMAGSNSTVQLTVPDELRDGDEPAHPDVRGRDAVRCVPDGLSGGGRRAEGGAPRLRRRRADLGARLACVVARSRSRIAARDATGGDRRRDARARRNVGLELHEWKGSFYPDDLKPAAMLRTTPSDSARSRSIATFYRMRRPRSSRLGGRRAAGLHVVSRLHSASRTSRLRDVDETVRVFGDVARGLGAGWPLLFQLPPNFKKDVGRLGDVLYMVPPDLRIAGSSTRVVVRRRRVRAAARAQRRARHRRDEDATTPALATATGGISACAPSITPTRAWGMGEDDPHRRAGWGDAFVFFKHEERGTGPALAQRLETLLAT